MKKLALTILLAAMTWGGAAFAAHPGVVNFGNFSELDDAKLIASVDLSGWLMNLLQTAAEDDPDAAIFAGIEAVTVRVFETGEPRRYARLIESLRGDLVDDGWDDLAQVNDGEDQVRVMVKGDGDRLDGLTVMVVDSGGEAVFVNIAGHIDPSDLGKLMGQIDVGNADIDIDW